MAEHTEGKTGAPELFLGQARWIKSGWMAGRLGRVAQIDGDVCLVEVEIDGAGAAFRWLNVADTERAA